MYALDTPYFIFYKYSTRAIQSQVNGELRHSGSSPSTEFPLPPCAAGRGIKRTKVEYIPSSHTNIQIFFFLVM